MPVRLGDAIKQGRTGDAILVTIGQEQPFRLTYVNAAKGVLEDCEVRSEAGVVALLKSWRKRYGRRPKVI